MWPKAELLGNSTQAVETLDMAGITEVSSGEGERKQNVLGFVII